jgi:hypothetical protein
VKKLAAFAFAAALGFGVVPQGASAAPVSSGALDLLMNSQALKNGVSGETIRDGLVEPARYYYRRRYYRHRYYRHRYYYRRHYYRRHNYRPRYRYYHRYRYY